MKKLLVVSLMSLVLLGVGGAAIAAQPGQDQGKGQGQGQEQGQGKGNKLKEARKHVMRSHREVFLDGKVAVVDTDRGELLSTSENSVEIKYEDSSTARIEAVGKLTVCANGSREGSLADLKAGDQTMVIRATNTPKGDHTVVVKQTGEGRPCAKSPGQGQPNGQPNGQGQGQANNQ